jgi:5-hydroxyisourate hydrolase / 2-oxo-4-hydroxy-4-carboxy-5-ureidoimidazoline decarboxylase
MDALKRLDALGPEDALAAFLRCCGSRRWAEAMERGRPYRDEPALLEAGERAFAALVREDWLEAFSHHPRIGDRGALAARYAATPSGSPPDSRGEAWAATEQGAVAGAGEDVLDALLRGNREYEARFGHIFIVCASGKAAPEMLALLRERLPNEPAAELQIAAAEQRKITAIRLGKLLAEGLEMSGITTHVLDTSLGRPAGGVAVTLERREGGAWIELGHGRTDTDGRCKDLLPPGSVVQQSVYRLTFDSAAYFGARGTPTFYPEVSVVFEVREPAQHHHVPLLLSPFGYSTYRGS